MNKFLHQICSTDLPSVKLYSFYFFFSFSKMSMSNSNETKKFKDIYNDLLEQEILERTVGFGLWLLITNKWGYLCVKSNILRKTIFFENFILF